MNRTVGIGLLVGSVVFAQSSAPRAGISVDMAITTSATPLPQADQAGSRIVTVTRSGAVYLDITEVTPAALTNELRIARNAKVYVKADARAPYTDVVAVLGAIRAAGAGAVNLLTSQRDPKDGRDTPPKGVGVSFGTPGDSSEKAVVLEISGAVSFGDAVRIIDASRSSGARVFFR